MSQPRLDPSIQKYLYALFSFYKMSHPIINIFLNNIYIFCTDFNNSYNFTCIEIITIGEPILKLMLAKSPCESHDRWC